MTSIYLQLNAHKKYHNKLPTNTQETDETLEKIDDKTKSTVIQQQNINCYKKNRNNYYLRRYENYFHKKLVIKYNALPQEYNLIQLDNFIKAKYCHDLAVFKENLLYNDSDELLKRYYMLYEAKKKIPIFSEFYKSYLDFFCFPTFAELKLNDFIEEMIENKAKAFYNENYLKEEEKKIDKNSPDKIDTIIFNEKVRKDLSRKNSLTDLSKTTIKNNLSNKSSINSTKTINNILDILRSKTKLNNITFNKISIKNNLLKREDNNCSQTERMKKIDINNSKIISNDNSNCITDRNNKKNINLKKSIIMKNFLKKGIKTEKNSKNNLIKLMRNKYIVRKLSQKNYLIKNKYNNSKKNSKNNNNNNKENKKLNSSNNLLKNAKSTSENNKKTNISNTNKIKNNKKYISKKVIKIINNNLKVNNTNDNNGHNTERESKHYIPNISKIDKKAVFDKKFRTFLKIALNFNKSPPKKKSLIFNKKMKSKDSKASITDRNKSNKLKNKINQNSNINANLTEYLKCYKKNSIKTLKNKLKKIQPLSRNYKIGFEDIKTSIVKSSLRNNKLKDNSIKNNCYNSSKKKLGVCNRFSLARNSYSKNKTQKILRTSKEASSFFKKEKNNLTTLSITHWQSKKNHNKITNFKTINVKKSILPLNKLIIMSMGLSNNNNHAIKKQATLNKINIPNL